MTKQEYVLKLLSVIDQDILPIAEDLRILIETNQISDDLIDILVTIFKKAITTTNNMTEKEKLQKGLQFLNTLQQQEQRSKLQDDADIQELEGLLADM